jgi:hypothetical protein
MFRTRPCLETGDLTLSIYFLDSCRVKCHWNMFHFSSFSLVLQSQINIPLLLHATSLTSEIRDRPY